MFLRSLCVLPKSVPAVQSQRERDAFFFVEAKKITRKALKDKARRLREN